MGLNSLAFKYARRCEVHVKVINKNFVNLQQEIAFKICLAKIFIDDVVIVTNLKNNDFYFTITAKVYQMYHILMISIL